MRASLANLETMFAFGNCEFWPWNKNSGNSLGRLRNVQVQIWKEPATSVLRSIPFTWAHEQLFFFWKKILSGYNSSRLEVDLASLGGNRMPSVANQTASADFFGMAAISCWFGIGLPYFLSCVIKYAPVSTCCRVNLTSCIHSLEAFLSTVIFQLSPLSEVWSLPKQLTCHKCQPYRTVGVRSNRIEGLAYPTDTSWFLERGDWNLWLCNQALVFACWRRIESPFNTGVPCQTLGIAKVGTEIYIRDYIFQKRKPTCSFDFPSSGRTIQKSLASSNVAVPVTLCWPDPDPYAISWEWRLWCDAWCFTLMVEP